MHLSPPPRGSLGRCLFYGSSPVVVDLLFNVPPSVCVGYMLVFVLKCMTLCLF